MKKIALLSTFIVSLFLIGCGPIKPHYLEKVYSLDYSEFTKDGFFLTESNSVGFDYTTVSSIVVDIYLGEGDNWHYYKGKMYRTSGAATPYTRSMQLAVAEAKENGANGIINLKFKWSIVDIVGTKQEVITLTGMAIKR